MGSDQTRKQRWAMVACVLFAAASASAVPRSASISGSVRNTAGVPQMGAVVEVLAGAMEQPLTVYTNARGHYTADGLAPGKYVVKVSAPSFLPSLRENVLLRSGSSMVINLTLNTLFEAIALLPIKARSAQDDDDWRWTLRSTASRPILRVLDDGPLVVTSKSDNQGDRELKARVAFFAGSSGESFSDNAGQGTTFTLEQSLFSSGKLFVDGSIGANSSAPVVFRAGYGHQLPNGSHPEMAVTYRHFNTPDTTTQEAALTALALTLSDNVAFGNFAELSYGGEYDTVQFLGRSADFRPFATFDVHLSPQTLLEYRFQTALPDERAVKGFDSAPADLSETNPRLSLVDYAPRLEHARHHEISLARRMGKKTTAQVAVYSDHLTNAAGLGVGATAAAPGSVLPDIYSGTFNYNAGTLSARGVRVLLQQKFAPELSSTLTYSYVGTLTFAGSNVPLQEAMSSFATQHRHAITASLSGRVPRARTRWFASYKWTDGRALIPVDSFSASPGQADPYLNLFVRQPLPAPAFMPGQMEALVEVRNLLAQGYVPV